MRKYISYTVIIAAMSLTIQSVTYGFGVTGRRVMKRHQKRGAPRVSRRVRDQRPMNVEQQLEFCRNKYRRAKEEFLAEQKRVQARKSKATKEMLWGSVTTIASIIINKNSGNSFTKAVTTGTGITGAGYAIRGGFRYGNSGELLKPFAPSTCVRLGVWDEPTFDKADQGLRCYEKSFYLYGHGREYKRFVCGDEEEALYRREFQEEVEAELQRTGFDRYGNCINCRSN
ncbi:MAG: hypothetical protein ISR65_07425 [Bacteriovoracaceae bacterium]|nr:hypothetical protein [Bacteriovoracaceae bacterium]